MAALPISTRTLTFLSYHHCRRFHLSLVSTPPLLSFSLLKLRPHQTLSSHSHSPTTKPQQTNNVIDILEQRGLIESITSDNLRSATSIINKETPTPLKVYCGFDPTAESLHLGNLIGIIVLSWFQKCGHVPVAVLGGATGRVGDPSGKSTERPELDETSLDKNIQDEFAGA